MNNALTDVTIIIPTYNRNSHLERLLNYYSSSVYILNILVLDSSNDDIIKSNIELKSIFKNGNIEFLDFHSIIYCHFKNNIVIFEI